MFRFVKTILGLIACAAIVQSSKAQTVGNAADLPYTLELKEATQTALPGLHSFAFGREGEYWIAIGGRINGSVYCRLKTEPSGMCSS